MPRLVEMLIEWRGESTVQVELLKELEFREGKMAHAIKLSLVKQVTAREWDHSWERHERWEQCKSIAHVLRSAESRLWKGVELLRAAAYPVMWRGHAPVEHRKPIRRAIAWNDGGRLTTETGAPGSVDRCQLLIDVFTRAIAIVRREGLERGGPASDHWPNDRKLIVSIMQDGLRRIKSEGEGDAE